MLATTLSCSVRSGAPVPEARGRKRWRAATWRTGAGAPGPGVPVEGAPAQGFPEGAARLEAAAERAEDKPVRSST